MTNNNHQPEHQKLHKMLLEDLENLHAAEELLSTAQQLQHWQAPVAAPQLTSALIEHLTAELPVAPKSLRQKLVEWWPLLLLFSQIRVVGRSIWLASVLVMGLGTLVTLATFQWSGTPLLALLAPIVATVGVALLYDSDVEQILELENVTAASTRLLLLARLTLVFSFNLVLGLMGSLLLAAVQDEVSLWPLVLSWLAPMAFLSALAFLLSVLLVDALVSAAVSLTLWGLHIWLRYAPFGSDPLTSLFSFPGLNHPVNQPVLFVGAGLLLLVALWVVGRSEYRRGVSS